MSHKFSTNKKLLYLVLLALSLVSAMEAATFNVADGDWSVSENWDPVGLPGASDVALINGDNVCEFNTTASVQQLQLGVNSDGTLNISGGTLTTGNVDQSVLIGNPLTYNTGTLNMTGGQIIANSRMAIGGGWNNGAIAVVNLSGDAKLSQVGGITHASIGYGPSSVVDITMSGTSVMEFTNLGSSHYVDLRLGDITVNMSDDSSFYSSGNIRTGVGSASLNATDIDILLTDNATMEAGNGIYLYDGAELIIGGQSAVFAGAAYLYDGSTINISAAGSLNFKDMTEPEVQDLIDDSKITGVQLQVSTVDIDGTMYTQVVGAYTLLNVTTAKNCSPANISGDDCVADLSDLEVMAGQWLDTGAVVSDLSGNSVVDFEDFAMLAGYWLDEGPFETPTDEFTVLKSPGSSSYTPGSSVSLIAVPQEGWRLDHWTGDLTSGSYIAEVIMDSDKNITAVYSQSNAAHDEIDYTNLPIIIPGQDPITSESPYIYERDIYGYNPSFYPGEPAFDSNNNSYIRVSSSINDYTDGSNAIIQKLKADGSWQIWNVLEEARRSYPSATGLFEGVASEFSRIVIDGDDWVYTVVRLEGSPGDIILYKLPEEETWRALDIPSLSYPKLEPFEGYSPPKPPIVIGVVSGGLKMLRLSKLSGSLTINKEIDLNTGIVNPIFMPTHSGSSRVTATVNNKSWFCFASKEQQYDQNGDPISGTPQYISNYDHASQTVSDPILLGFGQNRGGPEPDGHNGPAMVADSTGLLHVVMGAHNDYLWYTHSTTTNPTSISEWTAPVTTGISFGTYPSLVIDSNDTLHLIARDEDGSPKHLAYARAERSGSTWTWDDMGNIVIPWHDNYSIYYQKLSIDNDGRLFLFYRYYHNGLTQAEVAAYEAKYGVSAGADTGGNWYDGIRAQEPAVLMSDDGGDTWRIALTGDFLSLDSAVGEANFNVANGDWSVAGNWNPWWVPGSSDIAIIGGSRVCNFNTTASVEQLKLGVGSNGTLNISGGTLITGNVDRSVWIGDGAGNTGYLTMTGGEIISDSRMSIGGNFNNNPAGAVVNLSGDAKISQVGGIGHAAIGYGLGSVVDITMSGTSVMEFTTLAANQYVDLRLGDIAITQSDSSLFYSSGNIRLGGTVSVIGQGISWTMTGGTIEAGYGIYLYNDSHINIGGDSVVFASFLDINDTCTIHISNNGSLNFKDMTEPEVQDLIDDSKITGVQLQVSTVDIDGTMYTQVVGAYTLLNVTTAKNCSPADISGDDCVADLSDLEVMAGQWLDTGAVVSDISGNNVVDFEDFAMLAAYWLDEGPFETPTDEFTVLKSPGSSSYFSGSSVSLIAMPEEG